MNAPPRSATLYGLVVILSAWAAATGLAAQEGQQTVGDLTVYLGVVPAEIVKEPMHGGAPKGAHEHDLVAAVFNAKTGARVSDASVTAQVSGLGLAGARKRLAAMEIAGTTTYGGFFSLPGADLYTVRLAIERGSGSRPVVVDFKYDHRRR